jgi:DNA-binding NarL/FixJ family response regulator
MLIRVLLAVPPALRDAFTEVLANADDIHLHAVGIDALEVLLATGALRADVVVILMERGEVPGIASHLVAEYPHVKVLGVTGDARLAMLYELQPRLVSLGEISPSGLLSAIRTAMRSEVAE